MAMQARSEAEGAFAAIQLAHGSDALMCIAQPQHGSDALMCIAQPQHGSDAVMCIAQPQHGSNALMCMCGKPASMVQPAWFRCLGVQCLLWVHSSPGPLAAML